ncbi:hypothetical protein D3C76_1373300 [compost metagenome]
MSSESICIPGRYIRWANIVISIRVKNGSCSIPRIVKTNCFISVSGHIHEVGLPSDSECLRLRLLTYFNTSDIESLESDSCCTVFNKECSHT